jgi:mannose-6-phosphate isomerase
MTARELSPRAVERVWGRAHLPAMFDGPHNGKPIGEIWFPDTGAVVTELLVKYLFTADRLSVQVHPDDAAARAHGYPRGKDEAWLVLEAEPDAVIGLGLKQDVSRDALKSAALDGSIEALLDWRPVRTGEIFYSPAGTIHAIGAGLSLIEIQQNLDLTYRLYDYGRPRELHLDAGVAVADLAPWTAPFIPHEKRPGREVLAAGRAFVLERWTFADATRLRSRDGQLQLIPLRDGGMIDGAPLAAGTVWRVEDEAQLDASADLLAAYPGSTVRPDICVAI